MNADDLRRSILAVDDLPREEVDVPEWKAALNGTKLYLRGLSAAEQMDFAQREEAAKGRWDKVAADLIIKTLVTESGEPVFTPEDAEALEQRSAAVLTRLMTAAARLSGFDPEASEGLAQDFATAQNDGSSTE